MKKWQVQITKASKTFNLKLAQRINVVRRFFRSGEYWLQNELQQCFPESYTDLKWQTFEDGNALGNVYTGTAAQAAGLVREGGLPLSVLLKHVKDGKVYCGPRLGWLEPREAPEHWAHPFFDEAA